MNNKIIPETLDSAIEVLYESLSITDINFIKANSPTSIHFSGGMNLRNDWNLWEKDTPLKKDIKTKFNLFAHADDCSGLIYAGLWSKVKGQDIGKTLNEVVNSYKKHWKREGINPETGEEMFKIDRL